MGDNEYAAFLDVLGQLGLLVAIATMVERVLAFVFEYEWFVRFTTKIENGEVVSKFPGLKGLLALTVSLGISCIYKFDILQVVFRLADATSIGMTFTGFVIAGGSAGAISIFQGCGSFA